MNKLPGFRLFAATAAALYMAAFAGGGALTAGTYHSINADGDLSEWNISEIIAADGNDSDWNPGTLKNEIQNLYAAWDSGNLYIGVEGKVDGKGILVFIDAGKSGGFSDLREARTWNRRASFTGWAPDFFYAAWDGSGGNFYRLSSSFTAEDVSGRCVLKNSKTASRAGWEIKIPFDLMYSRGNFVPAGAVIKVCAALATGDVGSGAFGPYGYLGGDSAPDNPVTGLSDAALGAFALVEPDKNSDGVSDNAAAGLVLTLSDVRVEPVRFAPAVHGTALVSMNVNKTAAVSAAVYDISGVLIKTLAESPDSSDSRKIFFWDGADETGAAAGGGVYVINIRATAGSESARTNKAVVVIRR